jgi:signal peptidase I
VAIARATAAWCARRVLAALFTSFWLPGFAQERAGARQRAIVWLVLAVAAGAAILFTMWALAALLAVRVVCAVDAAWCARKPVTAPRSDLPSIIIAVVGMVALFAIGLVTSQKRSPSSSMTPTLQIGDHFLIDKLASVHRGDVIVFDMPCDPSREYAKRVVAVAGDTVEVRCEVLYLNGKPVKRELLDANCTYEDLQATGQSYTTRCTRFRETLDDRSYDVFGAPPHGAGSDGHDFPDREKMPVPPSCGAAMDMDPSVKLSPDQHVGKIVDGPNPVDPCMPSEHYVVPEDSLFVLGDNRANSNDSRYWGVVPTSHVLGRVIGIWYPLSRFGDVH